MNNTEKFNNNNENSINNNDIDNNVTSLIPANNAFLNHA